MKNLLTISVLFFILLACGNPAPMIEKGKGIVQEYFLSEEDIYSGDKIQLFLQNKLKYNQEATELFLKGMNSYKNEVNLDSAEIYFTRSILKQPTAKAYYELGNVMLDKKKYDNTLKAYGLAEQLGFEPYSKILYNTSCVYSLKEEDEMAGKYLEYSIQAGYTNMDNINKDPDLQYLRDSYYFSKALENGLKGMSDPAKLFWLQFKRLFPKLNKPVTLDPYESSISTEDIVFISYDFEKYISEMRDEKFSREVSKGFYYYGVLTENDIYVALIYIVKDEYMGDGSPMTYRLATFDNGGKLIDKREISGTEFYADPVKVATIDSKLNITIDLYETKYEKDPEEFGYSDNKIIGKEKIGSESYKLSGNGQILETSASKELAEN